MQTIYLDFSHINSMSEVHDIFRKTLSFPDYYGSNLDALYDMLSTWSCCLQIIICKDADGKWKRLLPVLEDAGEENPLLTIVVR